MEVSRCALDMPDTRAGLRAVRRPYAAPGVSLTAKGRGRSLSTHGEALRTVVRAERRCARAAMDILPGTTLDIPPGTTLPDGGALGPTHGESDDGALQHPAAAW